MQELIHLDLQFSKDYNKLRARLESASDEASRSIATSETPEKVSQLEDELRNLGNEFALVKRERDRLKSEKEQSVNFEMAKDASEAKTAEIRAELETSNATLITTRLERDHAQKLLEDERQKLSDLIKANADAGTSKNGLNAEIAKLREQLKKLERNAATENQDIKDLQKELEDLKKDLSKAKTKASEYFTNWNTCRVQLGLGPIGAK